MIRLTLVEGGPIYLAAAGVEWMMPQEVDGEYIGGTLIGMSCNKDFLVEESVSQIASLIQELNK